MARTTAAILVLTVLLSGCAATPGDGEAGEASSVDIAPAAMPDDWSLDATVLAGRDAAEHVPAHLRPARYTLFPDGSLHYGAASDDRFDRGAAWLPPRTRTLSRDDLRGVWALARDLGFADPAAGETPRNLALVYPPTDGRTFVIAVSGRDVRRMFLHTTHDEASGAPAARLVRHLAQLAWADDRTDEPALPEPLRYDLGPDPYARYRDR